MGLCKYELNERVRYAKEHNKENQLLSPLYNTLNIEIKECLFNIMDSIGTTRRRNLD